MINKDKSNLRLIYSDRLINIAKQNKKIVLLDSDSKEPLMLEKFASIYPDRCFTFGIAEQDMVSAAGGMSTYNLIPFVNSYGMFIAMRALDQVRNAIAYPNLNVKFIISHHGLDAGSDGITHQLTEDVGIFRTIPNLKIMQPADCIEMEQMVDYAVNEYGPMVIKVGKTKVPKIHNSSYKWKYGFPSLINKGEDYAIIGCGIMLEKAINAQKKLIKKYSINPTIINMSSFTEIDVDYFLSITSNVKHIVTIEDHSINGGIGSIVSELMSFNKPIKISRIGLKSTFAECGDPDLLFRKYDMDEKAIINAIRDS
tara:strand:- start:937 stop:1872 length:936 start_codon:yes stop_codon:yes gene_type:complete